MKINGMPLLQEDRTAESLILRFAQEPDVNLVAPFVIETDVGEKVYETDEYTELKSKTIDFTKNGECTIVFVRPNERDRRIAELEERVKADSAYIELLEEGQAESEVDGDA